MLVSVDVYRPAAREQLRVVGAAVGVTAYQDKESNDPLTLVKGAMKHAQDSGFDTLLIDTAGRLHIDDELMVELEQIKAETKPIGFPYLDVNWDFHRRALSLDEVIAFRDKA